MINVGRRSCLCSWPGRQLTHFELLPNWDGQDLAYAPHQLPLAERFIAATNFREGCSINLTLAIWCLDCENLVLSIYCAPFHVFHNKTCTRSAMESVIVGKGFWICLVKLGDQLNPTLPLGVVELLEQSNWCANKMELVSLQPVLLFHQLRSGLAPVWIHGDWLAPLANISFRYFGTRVSWCHSCW